MYTLVIHSFFTVVSIAAVVVCVLQVRSARTFLRGARHHLAAVEDIEDRFATLQKGIDKGYLHADDELQQLRETIDRAFIHIEQLQRRHQENLGRIGALTAKLKEPERADRNTIDFIDENPDRLALERKLAERTHRG